MKAKELAEFLLKYPEHEVYTIVYNGGDDEPCEVEDPNVLSKGDFMVNLYRSQGASFFSNESNVITENVIII